MSLDSTRLHQHFETLAETITSPGPLDIDHAVSAGHRKAVRRRTLQTGGATVGAAALAALVLATVHVVGPPPARTVTVSPSPTVVTDPVANKDSFGWLPHGMQADGYSFAQPGQATAFGIAGIVAETGNPNSPELLLGTASGPRPELSLDTEPVKPPAYTPGPLINGHKSYVEADPGSGAELGGEGFYYLLWQFDDGTWATLQVTAMHSTPALDAQDVVHIARTVTEKPYPIPQWFRISAPLAGAEVVKAHMSGQSTDLVMRAGSAEIDVTVQPKSVAGQAGQECKTGIVVSACVAVHGTLPPSLATGGVRGILGDITLEGMPVTDVMQQP